jgi:cyclopropane fatty-acyl-phospholipid synthase-like methyltransferase
MKQNVAKYYDLWTEKYLSSGYGNIIQAHRPGNVEELLDYIAAKAGIKNGMKILDAGCGVCGPAIYFAKKFDVQITAITISEKQVEIAQQLIKKEKLNNKVEVLLADYHNLKTLFKTERFDLVMMLESYGHSQTPKEVLEGIEYVLKKEGHIYIKDYFKKPLTGSKERKKAMKRVIKNMNDAYSYNLPSLEETIQLIRETDLELEYITRNQLPLQNDDSVLSFEAIHGIDLFEGGFHYQILEPLELYFKKLTDIDAPIV